MICRSISDAGLIRVFNVVNTTTHLPEHRLEVTYRQGNWYGAEGEMNEYQPRCGRGQYRNVLSALVLVAHSATIPKLMWMLIPMVIKTIRWSRLRGLQRCQ